MEVAENRLTSCTRVCVGEPECVLENPGRVLANHMIITRPSEGLRSSSLVWSIQVDWPGTRETVPDRFRLIQDDILRKLLILMKNNDDDFEKYNLVKIKK